MSERDGKGRVRREEGWLVLGRGKPEEGRGREGRLPLANDSNALTSRQPSYAAAVTTWISS